MPCRPAESPASSIVRKAFSIICLVLAVAFFGLQSGDIHIGFPFSFLCAASVAAVPVVIGRRILRMIGILLLLLAAVGAQWEFQHLADLKVHRTQYARFLTSARNVHGKIRGDCLAHPSESFASLDDYVSRGILTTEDVAFLHDAKVTCYPFLPNGTGGDTFIEVWQGKRRTLISQDGGVFSYNASKINYLGSSPGPSKAFLDTVNEQYPGTIPTSTPTKK